MSSFNFYKNRKLFVIIPILIVIASFAVLLTAGAGGADGVTYYYADIDAAADLTALDKAALLEDVKDVVGGSNVTLDYVETAYNSRITVELEKGLTIDEKALVDTLNEKYPDFKVESLSSKSFSGVVDRSVLVAFLTVFALVAIILLLLNWFFFSFKNAAGMLAVSVLNALLVVSVYTLSRCSDAFICASAVFATLVLTEVIGFTRLRSVEKLSSAGKLSTENVANTVAKDSVSQSVSLLLLAFIMLIAFVAASVIASDASFAYIAALVFAAVAFPIYSGVFLFPNVVSGK